MTSASDIHFQLPEHTTVLDESLFYQSIDQLTLSRCFKSLNGHCPHVRTLILECDPPSLATISKIVDLRQIRNLMLGRLS